jgi:hypothetical protein
MAFRKARLSAMFLAFALVERTTDASLRALDALCERVTTTPPAELADLVGAVWPHGDRAFARAFYDTLRTTTDALIASHMLHATTRVTYVSPDAVQDTFY